MWGPCCRDWCISHSFPRHWGTTTPQDLPTSLSLSLLPSHASVAVTAAVAFVHSGPTHSLCPTGATPSPPNNIYVVVTGSSIVVTDLVFTTSLPPRCHLLVERSPHPLDVPVAIVIMAVNNGGWRRRRQQRRQQSGIGRARLCHHGNSTMTTTTVFTRVSTQSSHRSRGATPLLLLRSPLWGFHCCCHHCHHCRCTMIVRGGVIANARPLLSVLPLLQRWLVWPLPLLLLLRVAAIVMALPPPLLLLSLLLWWWPDTWQLAHVG